MRRMKKILSILLCLCMLSQYAPVMAFAAAEDGLCAHHTEHTADCGYAQAVAGSDCTHVCGEDCAQGCTHAHDDACGYVAAVAGHECHYECAECAVALTSEVDADPATEPATEPSTEPSAEASPECNCGTDDASIHATNCPLYAAPENPVCTCVEKCEEANVWCDVCGFDVTACTGEDTAVTYDPVSYIECSWNGSKVVSTTNSVSEYTPRGEHHHRLERRLVCGLRRGHHQRPHHRIR